MDPQDRPGDILPEHALRGVTAEQAPPVAAVPRRVGVLDVAGAVLAWLVILGVGTYLVVRNVAMSKAEEGDGASWLVTVESQGRYFVGVSQIGEELAKSNPAAGKQLSKKELFASAKSLNQGSYSQRMRYAILAGEMAGPAEARHYLREIEKERAEGMLEARDVSVEAAGLLDKLYKGYEAGTTDPAAILDEAQREKLRVGLRWYGELALAPEGGDPAAREAVTAPAMRTAIAYLLLSTGILAGLLGGLVVIGFVAVQVWRGKLRPAIETESGRAGVYAETFAVYVLLFFGMSFGLRYVPLGRFMPLAMMGAMFASLIALAWPVLRGVAWRQVREEVGLTFGGRPWTRVLLGPVTYLGAIPLLAAGVLLMFGLMKLTGVDANQPGKGPSHPIVNVALQHDVWLWVQIFLVAAVAAPIVEEIMFRGVLYRHLRGLTNGLVGAWLSAALSVLVSGFIFAIIHPQGWLGVPVLLALATAFAVSREFQRSLGPPMIAHGINNAVALALLAATAG
jgi:membrane protease YdiL (CAAX protease family)